MISRVTLRDDVDVFPSFIAPVLFSVSGAETKSFASRANHTAARAAMASSRAFARAFTLAVSVLLAFAPPASAGGWDSGGRAAEAEAEVPANAPACVSCEVIARELETALYALEGHDVDVAGLTEEEHARKAARRRSLMHGRSELRIDETLEGFCDAFAGDRKLDGSDRDSDVLPGHCVSLLDAHGETVGDHVFAHGPRHMRDLLCVRLARACPVLVGTKRDDEGEL